MHGPDSSFLQGAFPKVFRRSQRSGEKNNSSTKNEISLVSYVTQIQKPFKFQLILLLLTFSGFLDGDAGLVFQDDSNWIEGGCWFNSGKQLFIKLNLF